MKIYKSKKYLIYLLTLLFLSSIFFGVSVYLDTGGKLGGGKIFVLAFLSFFILFNLITTFLRKVTVESDKLTIKTLFTNKTVFLEDIQDIGVIRLKGRYSVLIYFDDGFAMLPSTISGFKEIVDTIKNSCKSEVADKLDELNEKTLRKQSALGISFLLFANIFLISLGIYNLFV
ncbi:hypothetical protein Flexsi_1001 [Flexistipes sinusarabici DSM 4947]|uniref:PH domain-containing protein n=1 Tax=Flexistipes sinusarabici (strain ATCC 49648 / DSM 4947 / MAS 10) TaxID=717231 RepID=F8E5M9_FLESM|nr:hypothetical protein [Flexistipes sinusarabici]AEI14660.1 hypothetical protein Flexsi_1001 [Flexistipes sinusarabici DSM 4947]